MKYEDLLSLPFEINGRFGKTEGIDCYGVCIEMVHRDGRILNDVVYPSLRIPAAQAEAYSEKLNVAPIAEEEAGEGDIVQGEYEGYLHVAYMLDKKTVIHATFSGVRVSPIIAIKNRKYMRVQ